MVKHDQLFVQKHRSIMLRKDEQALQPVVGNFDTLGEATSQEKALVWWGKTTPKAVVYLVDYSLTRIGLAKSVYYFWFSVYLNQAAAIYFVIS